MFGGESRPSGCLREDDDSQQSHDSALFPKFHVDVSSSFVEADSMASSWQHGVNLEQKDLRSCTLSHLVRKLLRCQSQVFNDF